MSTFRKFTNCCAGFAVFIALMECFTQFMTVSPDELTSMKEKLLLFFSSENSKDYTGHLILILWILLSLIVSLLFRKKPYVGFAAVTVPFVWSWILFFDGRLYHRAYLIPLLLTLCVAGAVFDCIAMDRRAPKSRGFLVSNLSAATPVLLCAWILYQKATVEKTPPEQMGLLEGDVFRALSDGKSFEIYQAVILLYLISILISVLFFELYYIDGVVSLIPAGYTIYHFYAGHFPLFGEVMALIALLSVTVRLSVMFCCPPTEIDNESKKIKTEDPSQRQGGA